MNKYRNTDKDIHVRIYKFVVSCFRDVVRKIPKTAESIPIIGQLSSSLTSMGANDVEADAASSKKDFIAKYMIVRKETRETHYWLCVIRDTGILDQSIVNLYIKECEEIRNVVSSIIEHSR
ncbi:four helix bundle protein [Candidatus Gottesmanbacteria bacterium]|nr:four helix bundle protein [Candidatus Gottesmanbacteria bacterium]